MDLQGWTSMSMASFMASGIFGDFESRKYLELQSQRGESNPGPPDYESSALPTELRWHRQKADGILLESPNLSRANAGSAVDWSTGKPDYSRHLPRFLIATSAWAARHALSYSLSSHPQTGSIISGHDNGFGWQKPIPRQAPTSFKQ